VRNKPVGLGDIYLRIYDRREEAKEETIIFREHKEEAASTGGAGGGKSTQSHLIGREKLTVGRL